MSDLKYALIALLKVLLFEIIIGTIANVMGMEYRPYRYLGNYYPRTTYKPVSYKEFYEKGNSNGKIFL